MSKIVVKELAKEVNLKSKELVDFLHDKGYEDVKNMNSILSAEEEKVVRLEFAPETIKNPKQATKPTVKKKRVKPETPKPIKQTFDGRPPEIREAVAQKAKRALEKNSDKPIDKQDNTSKSDDKADKKTVKTEETQLKPGNKETMTETKPVLSQEEMAIAFAKKKASQAATLSKTKGNSGNKPKTDKKTRPARDNKDKGQSQKSQASSKGGSSFGKKPASSERNDNRRETRKNSQFKGGQKSQTPDDRIVTKTTSRDREREREKERAKDREKSEKNLSRRYDRNRALSKIIDEENTVRRKKKDPNRKGAFIKPEIVEKPVEEEIKNITIPETLTIKELADKMKIQPSIIIKKLFLQGKMYTLTQDISFEEAEEVALEFDIICELEKPVDLVAELLKEVEEDESLMERRPPVVCVMGHVDHGKTSLLDAIRSTKVTSREAGGITQSIGASVVTINGKKITFLDTPGHEAFTAMRMRGAKSTDIAILVVAADDGVKPQTIEAINHAKAAGIEIIVAVNKVDKDTANIEKVKQELTEYELIPEDWGGSTIFVPVSAKSKEGIDQLLEMVLLTADVAEYKANPNRDARGIVIEASLDKGRGPVATVLVQKGTLHVGDSISIGSSFGKVRAMIDDKGNNVTEAGPSIPVEILGLNGVPNSGDTMLCFKDDKEARAAAETFIAQDKARLIDESKKRLSLDGLFDQIRAGNVKELNVILKADVQGSVEAIKQSLEKLNNEEVAIRVIHGAVGNINESDISLASASNAIVIGFNVKIDAVAKDTSEREKVDVRFYKVIYTIISDIESAMKGMLEPVYEEKVIGHAEIRQIFKASGIGNIAGSYVLDGKVVRGCKARITREKDLIFEGNVASLKRFKDDVKEVNAGYECGLVFEKFNDLAEEDQVELYQMVEVSRS